MNVKERIFSIVLEEKIKKNPEHAKKIGVEVFDRTKDERGNVNGKVQRKN